jgi:alpha-aminoadipic semialdehyde synthase
MEPTKRLCQALLHQSSRQLCCRLTSPSRFILTPSSRSLSTTSAPGDGGEGRARVLGIRREESSVWERRAPLSPNHVQSLISKGVKVLIQPSSRRGYTVREYQKAGAVVTDDLSQADTIVGVKQPPLEHLIDDKTFVIFSHTIKAQPENMPLLDAILQKRIRLVDYECLLNEKKQRLVAFGQYAGVAGMINILHGLGVRLLALGHNTPFIHIGYAHNYSSSSSAKAAVATVGKEIQLGMYPESLGPMIFTFTGAGNVSQGAQGVFKELPHEYVSPLDLQNVVETGDCHKVYATVVDKADHLYRLAGGDYDDEEFEKFPDRYDSIFADKIAPYTTCLVNGVFWAPNTPRLLSIAQSSSLHPVHMDTSVMKLQGVPALPQRLLAVADISCDLHGSLEFMSTVTTIDNPFTMYNVHTNSTSHDISGNGILLMSIDNLPAQLPREATDYFGNRLFPFISEMV